MPKLFSLRRDLSYLTQGTMTVVAYYTKFKTLSDELNSLVTRPQCNCAKCTCNINMKSELYDQYIQVSQFLMGLSDHVTAIRGQILLMNPLPTLSQCYALILQEENQREVFQSTHNSGNMAMSAKAFPGSSHYPVSGSAGLKPTQGAKKSGVSGANSSLYCDYCRLTGHTQDKCFCLQGYPTWHKLYGKLKLKPKYLSTSTANSVSKGSVSAAQSSSISVVNQDEQFKTSCGISKVQYSIFLR